MIRATRGGADPKGPHEFKAKNLNDFKRGFVKAKGSLKKRLLRRLLKQVVLTSDGLLVFMYLADGSEIPNHQIKLVKELGQKANETEAIYLTRKASGDDSNLSALRSPIGKLGEPSTSISKLLQPYEIIEFRNSDKPDYSKEFIEKYEKGFSAKEIAIQYGCSKQKVLATLKRNRINIRPARPFTTTIANLYKGRRGRKPFYGFCYFEGEITKHPTEFPVLQLIYKAWLDGKAIHSINLDLHKRRVKAREGGKWSWAAIRKFFVMSWSIFKKKTVFGVF